MRKTFTATVCLQVSKERYFEGTQWCDTTDLRDPGRLFQSGKACLPLSLKMFGTVMERYPVRLNL